MHWKLGISGRDSGASAGEHHGESIAPNILQCFPPRIPSQISKFSNPPQFQCADYVYTPIGLHGSSNSHSTYRPYRKSFQEIVRGKAKAKKAWATFPLVGFRSSWRDLFDMSRANCRVINLKTRDTLFARYVHHESISQLAFGVRESI